MRRGRWSASLSVFLQTSTSNRVIAAQAQTPITITSKPTIGIGCPGVSDSDETTNTARSASSAPKARFGSARNDNILLRLMEMLTNNKPRSAAEAPTSATKKFCQSFIRPPRHGGLLKGCGRASGFARRVGRLPWDFPIPTAVGRFDVVGERIGLPRLECGESGAVGRQRISVEFGGDVVAPLRRVRVPLLRGKREPQPRLIEIERHAHAARIEDGEIVLAILHAILRRLLKPQGCFRVIRLHSRAFGQ